MRTAIAVLLFIGLLLSAVGCGSTTRTMVFVYDPPLPTVIPQSFGIIFPKVDVGDYWPGAVVVWPLGVINGSEEMAYRLSFRLPGPEQLVDGYERAPEGAEAWITIGNVTPLGIDDVVPDWAQMGDSTPKLKPHEIRRIAIILAVPNDLEGELPSRWQFNIAVYKAVPTGFFEIGYAQKVLVTMKQDGKLL